MTEYEKERERIRARRDDWEDRHGGGGGTVDCNVKCNKRLHTAILNPSIF